MDQDVKLSGRRIMGAAAAIVDEDDCPFKTSEELPFKEANAT